MIRIGLLGAGNMGRVHASAYSGLPGVEVVGVVGRGSERAQRLAANHGCRAYSSLEEMIAGANLTAVDVCVPTRHHEEVVTASLRAGVHVFCETPLAPDAAAARRMIAAARASERLLQVALLSRLAQPGVRLKEAVGSGELGTVEHAEFLRNGPRPDPAQVGSAIEHYGDVLEEFVLYDLDLAAWLFGVPQTVRATVERSGQIETAGISLIYEGGLRATFTGSFGLPEGTPYTVSTRVKGDRAEMSAVLMIHPDVPPSLTCLLTPAGGAPKRERLTGRNPYDAECGFFVACLLGAADPELLSADSALASISMMDAARRSIEAGDRVSL